MISRPRTDEQNRRPSSLVALITLLTAGMMLILGVLFVTHHAPAEGVSAPMAASQSGALSTPPGSPVGSAPGDTTPVSPHQTAVMSQADGGIGADIAELAHVLMIGCSVMLAFALGVAAAFARRPAAESTTVTPPQLRRVRALFAGLLPRPRLTPSLLQLSVCRT